MTVAIPIGAKRLVGSAMSAVNRQCQFVNSIFLIGHMRCGSTALANIVCSRPEVSGYGEAHIAYRSRGALGELVVNQIRRGVWRPQARHLFDKILHSRYDGAAPEAFFDARAIFLLRAPEPTIHSIRELFARLRLRRYAEDEAAARYYCERLEELGRLWRRFAPDRRIASSHERLMADPEGEVARIGAALAFSPALANSYRSPVAARGQGAGDPTVAPVLTSIVARAERTPDRPLDLSGTRRAALERSYQQFLELVS